MEHLMFDPASEDWVMVRGETFTLEPVGAEFVAPGAGQVVVTFGDGHDRHRGIEVTFEAGMATIWMPSGARAYWLADIAGRADTPWETRLAVLDHERGRLA